VSKYTSLLSLQVLNLLHDADPTSDETDPAELVPLETHVNEMGPLIDNELEGVDRRLAQLTRLSTELVDALNLYHQLMREMPAQQAQPMYAGYQQPYMQPPPMSMASPYVAGGPAGPAAMYGQPMPASVPQQPYSSAPPVNYMSPPPPGQEPQQPHPLPHEQQHPPAVNGVDPQYGAGQWGQPAPALPQSPMAQPPQPVGAQQAYSPAAPNMAGAIEQNGYAGYPPSTQQMAPIQ